MIDIENELYTLVKKAVRAEYPKAFVSGEYVRKPSSYPAVSFEQIDNQIWKLSRDSGGIEHNVAVSYEMNVFAVGTNKKTQCKKIAEIVNDTLTNLGFTRQTFTPVPNENDATVYRIVGRYRAIVSEDIDGTQYIYRR